MKPNRRKNLRVVGDRKAGSVPGYNYSPALHAAGFTWVADDLDRWLAGPRAFVPGSRMPVKILDPATRRDIISYLEEASRHAAVAPSNAYVAQHGR